MNMKALGSDERHKTSTTIEERHKAEWSQYFTSPNVARFMASLFSLEGARIRLLDPGAGAGSLTGAFLDSWQEHANSAPRIELTAYEIDASLLPRLAGEIERRRERLVETRLLSEDFIESAVNQLQFCPSERYTHVILNPPYKKIAADSRQRRLLRQAGIETVNLYAGFVALSVALLELGGQLVAITPRSFCNGPYYKSFREYILEHCAIRHIHLFETRNKAFGTDGVLQENVIFLLVKGAEQEDVTISTSEDHYFHDYRTHSVPFEQIVSRDNPERFIHIPLEGANLSHGRAIPFGYSLEELGIQVSTGPVVDFRVREYLRACLEAGSAPLFYPGHFVTHTIQWPLSASKKPNAIMVSPETRAWLLPNGFYTVVRRFSSKEEKRRIVASLVTPETKYGPLLGFENHLNVFHVGKSGLPEMIARGLMVYLSSTQVDQAFRQFSGHTQVNATDLRSLTYPGRDTLVQLGAWSTNRQLSQSEIDQMVESLA